MRAVFVKKKLRFYKFPDTCGHGLKLFDGLLLPTVGAGEGRICWQGLLSGGAFISLVDIGEVYIRQYCFEHKPFIT